MSSTKSTFLDLQRHEGNKVAFSRAGKDKITIISSVGIYVLVCFKNILYVEGLKYNLLNMNQLCDSEYIIFFSKDTCIVLLSNRKTVVTIKRKNNLCDVPKVLFTTSIYSSVWGW